MRTTLLICALILVSAFDFEKERIRNSYKEIAQRVNSLKTTWKATAYDRDFKPLLGAFLDGAVSLPEKKFTKKNGDLPESFEIDFEKSTITTKGYFDSKTAELKIKY